MKDHTTPPRTELQRLRIGVIGAGFIVNECHLVAYRQAGLNCTAIAARSAERLSQVATRHHIPRVYAQPEDLLADPDIDVLDIAVPPDAQLPLIRQACAERKVRGILAQKPLGMNLAEAVEAVRLCEAAGITLAVNQNMRYDPAARHARELLATGRLGEPVIASIDMRGIPHWMPWQQRLGWLTLRIMSIHHLDCFRFWLGTPERLYCSTRTDPRTTFPHTDGICAYILDYASGVRAIAIDDTWTGPAREGCPADLRISFRIEGTEGLALGEIGWCQDPYTTPSTLKFARQGDPGFTQARLQGSWFPDAFGGTMTELLQSILDRIPPELNGRDNLQTMALVEAAYLSAATHTAVNPQELLQAALRANR